MGNPFKNVNSPGLRPSSPFDSPRVDACSGQALNEGGIVVKQSEPSLVKGGQGELTLNSHSFETRRQELKPAVRKYADKVHARLLEIYEKYGATDAKSMYANAAARKGPKLQKKDVLEAAKLLGNLECALDNDRLPPVEAPEGLVVLHDVPSFPNGLPSSDELKDKADGYKFDWVWDAEYREGRPVGDFALTEKNLLDVGFDDPRKIRELLREMAEAEERGETGRPAKVFDIDETVAKKKAEDPDHPDRLTTKEILEAIDAAGCRPATFGELLAFAKEYWAPGTGVTAFADEEKRLQRVDAPYVYALGSPFSDSDGVRGFPCLDWNGAERGLNGGVLGDDWVGDDRFLVLRKLSS